MGQRFINRAGKNLAPERKEELEKAKRILQEKLHNERAARADKGGPEKAEEQMIRKLKGGQYRLYSRKINPKTGRRRNLGTFDTREEAEQHERAVQFFKRQHG